MTTPLPFITYRGEPPVKAHDADAAYDLKAAETVIIPARSYKTVDTTSAVDIPLNHVGLVCSRSGLASRGVHVLNAPGVVDPGYTGTIKAIIKNENDSAVALNEGDRIAQLLIQRVVNVDFKEGHAPNTVRGDNGIGSTGA